MSRHRNLKNLEDEYNDDHYEEEEDDDYEEDDTDLINNSIDDVYDIIGDNSSLTEDDIVYALRQTNYNPRAAVEWLFGGTRVSHLARSEITPSSLAILLSTPLNFNKKLPQSKILFPTTLSNTNLNQKSDIARFDFQNPSPDDVVLSKQKQAFKRGGEPTSSVSAPIQQDINIVAMNLQKDKKEKKDNNSKNTGKSPAKSQTPMKTPNKPKEPTSKNSATKTPTSKSHPTSTPSKLATDLESMNLSTPSSSSTPSTTSETETEKTDWMNDDDIFSIKAAPKSIKQHSVARHKELQEKIHNFKGKDSLSLVVIGHVDAGKSTTMGHLLFDLGYVDPKIMKKYQHESQQIGKGSFSFAWVLDEHEEERNRGVTIDVGINYFETENRKITLLDAPGHKDFVPNMISGAAQADVAVLVVDSQVGEFEAGFGATGQTKEHALLARSLGVSQLIVAVNKMDMCSWDKDRFDTIVGFLMPFLKQVGFNPSSVSYIPISGLLGENLVHAKDPSLKSWYKGSTLIKGIDSFAPTERAFSKSFRISISDVFKAQMMGLAVAGKIEAGIVSVGDKLLLEPVNEVCTVRSIKRESESVDWAKAGDNIDLSLADIEISHIKIGNLLSDPENPVPIVKSFRAQIITFNHIPFPITQGHQVILHTHHIAEAATITQLISILDRTTGEIKKKKPRALGENIACQVEIVINRPICVELYTDYKQLGRFMLRDHGKTIAAGIIEKFLDKLS